MTVKIKLVLFGIMVELIYLIKRKDMVLIHAKFLYVKIMKLLK